MKWINRVNLAALENKFHSSDLHIAISGFGFLTSDDDSVIDIRYIMKGNCNTVVVIKTNKL